MFIKKLSKKIIDSFLIGVILISIFFLFAIFKGNIAKGDELIAEDTASIDISGDDVVSNVSGWIWSENIGWISLSCKNPEVNSCGSSNYGISIDQQTGKFAGYGWSENIGWINFEPLGPYLNDPQYAALLDKITKKVSGWFRVLATDNSWDGWAKMAGSNYGVRWEGCGLVGWAWGGDVLGWISFSSRNCDADGDGKSDGAIIGCPTAGTPMAQYGLKMDFCTNNPPIVVPGSLVVNQPDYCVISVPSASFKWGFSDPDGDTQAAYQVQIATDNGFSSIVVDSGKVNSVSNSYAVTGQPNYNLTYYWRVKVWDNAATSAESDWTSGPSFSTPLHAYPKPDFIWVPDKPKIDGPVNFTDKSIAYGGAVIASWQWTFENAVPVSSNEQNPKNIRFQTAGNRAVSLTVSDSDGLGFCSKTSSLQTSLKPGWKEVMPTP